MLSYLSAIGKPRAPDVVLFLLVLTLVLPSKESRVDSVMVKLGEISLRMNGSWGGFPVRIDITKLAIDFR